MAKIGFLSKEVEVNFRKLGLGSAEAEFPIQAKAESQCKNFASATFPFNLLPFLFSQEYISFHWEYKKLRIPEK